MRYLLILALMFAAAPAHALSLMQISGISDMNLPSWGIGDPAPEAHIDMCVYAVLPVAGQYAIRVSSPGGYVLTNGANQIPYELYWDDGGPGNLGGNMGAQLTNNVTLTGRQNANVLSALCALGITGPTARLNLRISSAAMNAALAGTYTGTITLLLSAT